LFVKIVLATVLEIAIPVAIAIAIEICYIYKTFWITKIDFDYEFSRLFRICSKINGSGSSRK
jgi:hypothetical protein